MVITPGGAIHGAVPWQGARDSMGMLRVHKYKAGMIIRLWNANYIVITISVRETERIEFL